MGRNRGVNLQRLNQILDRQEVPRSGANYLPATLATREEAPSKSRPKRIQSKQLGREVHLMSTPELHAALLALFHPRLFDLNEQLMLRRWQFHPSVMRRPRRSCGASRSGRHRRRGDPPRVH